ncbi:hypothetical protein ACMD2_23820, partial [Ananas comosus]
SLPPEQRLSPIPAPNSGLGLAVDSGLSSLPVLRPSPIPAPDLDLGQLLHPPLSTPSPLPFLPELGLGHPSRFHLTQPLHLSAPGRGPPTESGLSLLPDSRPLDSGLAAQLTPGHDQDSALLRNYSLTLHLTHRASGKPFFITNAYGPPTWDGKEEFCSELLSLSSSCPSNWVICGDFNFTKNQSERKGQPWSSKAMAMFTDLINSLARAELKAQLLLILEEEEILWKTRAKQRWLKEGDGNTKFFHAVANGRKRSNTIVAIEDDTGQQITNEELKRSYFYQYFKRVLGIRGYPSSFGDWSAFTIKTATFQLGSDKAPADGFSLVFFQTFWDVVKEDIFKINKEKSELHYLGPTPSKAARLANILGCQVGRLPFRYLGLPLHNKQLRKEDWA